MESIYLGDDDNLNLDFYIETRAAEDGGLEIKMQPGEWRRFHGEKAERLRRRLEGLDFVEAEAPREITRGVTIRKAGPGEGEPGHPPSTPPAAPPRKGRRHA